MFKSLSSNFQNRFSEVAFKLPGSKNPQEDFSGWRNFPEDKGLKRTHNKATIATLQEFPESSPLFTIRQMRH